MTNSTKRKIEIALPLNADRSLPPAVLAQMAKAVQASGVVDHFHIFDQMMGWWPRDMWNTKNSPLAAIVPDLDSYGDPIAIAAYAAGAAPGAGSANGQATGKTPPPKPDTRS